MKHNIGLENGAEGSDAAGGSDALLCDDWTVLLLLLYDEFTVIGVAVPLKLLVMSRPSVKLG